MTRLTVSLVLSVLPALVVAQLPSPPRVPGPGRFPCTSITGDGRYNLFQIFCFDNVIAAPGDNDPNAITQGDQPTPTGSQCAQEPTSGAYFCGFAGARCTSDANCDNGFCSGGFCQGGFNQACAGNDSNCSGYLYCTGADGLPTASDTCGGIGAFCQDPRAVDPSTDAATAAATFNQYCASGFCNPNNGMCDNPPGTTTPPATTTTAAPTSTPFTVSGGVTTTRIIEAPVSVTCGGTSVASNCRLGANRARVCCAAGIDLCNEIHNANILNCVSVESGYYPCTSTSAADTEECCASVYAAYFGAGGEGNDPCAA